MEQVILTITENKKITDAFWRMVMAGDCSAITQPGQFIDIKLPGFYLRRPISVCDADGQSVTILYKPVGGGTEYMTTLAPGTELDVLTGLGNGFDPAAAGERPVLIGGGAGTAPMYLLAKKLLERGVRPQVILGFNTATDIFLEEEFTALGAEVTITTADGTKGVKGFVTDALADMEYTYTYACGPLPMLKAVYACAKTGGEYSFEERMGCGFGACMGCSCKTKAGYKRICKDGPVLRKEEILWED